METPEEKKERARIYREKNRERINAAYRERYAKNRKAEIARTRKWILENPERYKATKLKSNPSHRKYRGYFPEKDVARKALGNAIKAGKVIRKPCEVCGNLKSEAHHHKGYEPEYWFDVVFLCRRHHIDAHKTALTAQ